MFARDPRFPARAEIAMLAIGGFAGLLVEIFGEAGRHAWTATGVLQTPFGASVQLEMTLRLR